MTYRSEKHYSQAFPKTTSQRNGMTLRDYFAAKAMQGYVSRFGCEPPFDYEKTISRWSYGIADAMLEARDAKT